MKTPLLASASVALSVAATIAAFLISPLLRYAEPGGLIAGGLMLGIGSGLAYMAHARQWPAPLRELSTIPTALAIGFIGSALVDIQHAAQANDRRCLAIQRDMLSSMPLRSDDADLFQALGCRPQGQGSVYVTRPDDDLPSMFEKDARRAALPYRSPEPR